MNSANIQRHSVISNLYAPESSFHTLQNYLAQSENLNKKMLYITNIYKNLTSLGLMIISFLVMPPFKEHLITKIFDFAPESGSDILTD